MKARLFFTIIIVPIPGNCNACEDVGPQSMFFGLEDAHLSVTGVPDIEKTN